MLDPAELERYARHIVLRDVGGPGQAKLKAARVLVVGAGGLGAPVLMYLAAAGVGGIGIVDDDLVSLSNLQRQVIFGTGDVGLPKAARAGEAVARLKRQPGRGLFVGGVTLPFALAELGLIDEYEFIVHPRVAGHGPTLFAGLSKMIDLKLVDRLELSSGAVAMRYVPKG